MEFYKLFELEIYSNHTKERENSTKTTNYLLVAIWEERLRFYSTSTFQKWKKLNGEDEVAPFFTWITPKSALMKKKGRKKKKEPRVSLEVKWVNELLSSSHSDTRNFHTKTLFH